MFNKAFMVVGVDDSSNSPSFDLGKDIKECEDKM